MDYVKKTDLTGFRKPTAIENRRIILYVNKKIKKELRPMNFWLAVCSVISGAAFINLITDFRLQLTGDSFIEILFFIAAFIGLILIRKSSKTKKILLKKFAKEDYLVLDCEMYEVFFSNNLNSEAEANIFNSLNQYCTDKFLIDHETAKKFKSGYKVKLILVKCVDYYELLSENRLEVT